jgi:hypothetical protein
MPYSLPSAFFLISVVPPILPQLTEAGFAMPADGIFVGCNVGVRVETCAGAKGCCVHPAMKMPAVRQSRRVRMITILDFMYYPDQCCGESVKKDTLSEFFFAVIIRNS